uniref:Uncharacterized protein n=1 Tax=viral metagenome TaxID=1070528 RepID=A0A2V0RNL3_9ZZZZ
MSEQDGKLLWSERLLDLIGEYDDQTFVELENAWNAAVDQEFGEDSSLYIKCRKPELIDFIEHINALEANDKSPHNFGASFVKPGSAAGMAAGMKATFQNFAPGMDKSFRNFEEFMQFGQNAYSTAKDMRAKARAFVNRSRNKMAAGGNVGTDDGDGGISSTGFTGGNLLNPFGISLATPPIDVKLETGSSLNAYTRFYKDGRDNTSPIFVKVCNLNLFHGSSNSDLFSDSYIQDYLDNVVVADLLQNVQSRAVYNKYIAELVIPENFKRYINTIAFSLAVCCFWQNVVSYKEVSSNRNKGMDALYETLDPSDFLKMNILKQSLQKMMIPPTLYEFIHAIFAPYKQNHLPGSPLMIYSPWPLETVTNLPFTEMSGNGTNNTMVNIAIDRLNNEFIYRWNALMAKTNPTWSQPTIRGYTGDPLVDPGHTTLWVNSAYICSTTSNGANVKHFLPIIGAETDELGYNLHTDAPDGYLEALQQVDVTSQQTNSKYGPGIQGPQYYSYTDDLANPSVTTLESGYTLNGIEHSTSCYVYLDLDSIGVSNPGYYPVEWSVQTQSLSGNTYQCHVQGNGTIHYFQRFGTETVCNYTKMGSRFSLEKFLQWLFFKDFANGGNQSSSYDAPKGKPKFKPKPRSRPRPRMKKSKDTDKTDTKTEL